MGQTGVEKVQNIIVILTECLCCFRRIIDEVFDWANEGVVGELEHCLIIRANLVPVNSAPVTVLNVYAGASRSRMTLKGFKFDGMKPTTALR